MMPSYEIIPDHDRRFIESNLELREQKEEHGGVLSWMQRHKLLTTLGVGSLLAAGTYFTPGASEWVGTQFGKLYQSASGRVQGWLKALAIYLYGLVPENIRRVWELPGTIAEGAAKGAKAVAEEGGRIARDADLIRKHPGEAAKAFGESVWESAKSLRDFVFRKK